VFKYLKYENGMLKLGDEPMLFINLFPLIEEYRMHTTREGLDYNILNYMAFYQSGYNFVRDHTLPLAKILPKVVGVSCELFEAIGWGKSYAFKVNDKQNILIMKSKSSTFADTLKKMHGPQETPVDFRMSGIFAGSTRFYSKEDIECVEVACRAEKDVMECDFIAASPGNILDYIDKYYPERHQYAEKVLTRITELKRELKFKLEDG